MKQTDNTAVQKMFFVCSSGVYYKFKLALLRNYQPIKHFFELALVFEIYFLSKIFELTIYIEDILATRCAAIF